MILDKLYYYSIHENNVVMISAFCGSWKIFITCLLSSPPPPPIAVITVEVWITMPRSVACPPSQRNATTARALRTWWLSAPTRRWRPPQALRTNMRLPRPPAQGPGPTSAPRRRRSAPARLPWRAPPHPPRSPTHTAAPAPRGGGNPENNPERWTHSPLPPRPLMSPLNQGYLNPHCPPPPHLPRTCEKKWEVLIFFTFILFAFNFLIFLTSAAMATINGVRTSVNVCDWLTCCHLVLLWQPPLEWWLQGMTVFLVSISAAGEWNNVVWIFISSLLTLSSPPRT